MLQSELGRWFGAPFCFGSFVHAGPTEALSLFRPQYPNVGFRGHLCCFKRYSRSKVKSFRVAGEVDKLIFGRGKFIYFVSDYTVIMGSMVDTLLDLLSGY
jgi:hypothetical protein